MLRLEFGFLCSTQASRTFEILWIARGQQPFQLPTPGFYVRGSVAQLGELRKERYIQSCARWMQFHRRIDWLSPPHWQSVSSDGIKKHTVTIHYILRIEHIRGVRALSLLSALVVGSYDLSRWSK